MADENVTNQAPLGGAPAPEAAPAPAPTPAPVPAPQAEPELKFDPKDVEDNKLIAVLSYLWILFLVPMLMKKESPFCQFHAKQGLVLAIAGIVGMIIPFIGWVLVVVLFVVAIIAIIKTLSGEAWKIPYVYDFSRKLNL